MKTIMEEEKNKTIELWRSNPDGRTYTISIQRHNQDKSTRVVRTWKEEGKEDSNCTICRVKNIPFYRNKLLSWEFAEFGEWDYKAVLSGKKLAAVLDLYRTSPEMCREYENTMADIADSVKDKRDICIRYFDHYVRYFPPDNYDYNDKTTIVITRNGSLEDFFSINKIIEAYKKQGCEVKHNEHIREIFRKPLIELYEHSKYDICHWPFVGDGGFGSGKKQQAEIIASGLVLGQPIEATVGILKNHNLLTV